MKKINFFVAFGLIFFAAPGFAQDVLLPSLLQKSIKKALVQLKSGIVGSYPCHTVEYNWASDWVLSRTIETSYTTFGEPAAVEYNKDGSYTRELYSYNDQHEVTQALSQIKSDDSWVDSSREITVYNSLGNMVEFRTENWNGTGWVLDGGSQIAYVMDGNRISVMTMTSWNAETSAWDNASRETYSYSGSSPYFISAIIEMWDNGWVFLSKNEYTWTDNQISGSLNYSFDQDSWVLSGKTTYEYLSYGSMVMTTFAYVGPDTWMGTYKTTTTNDSHGNEILFQTEMFIMTWTPVTVSSYQLTYSGNNLIERITQGYSMYGQAPESPEYSVTLTNLKKEVFSNFASLGTNITFLPDAGLRVFPNPAGKQAIVRISSLETGSIILSLYNTTGQKILEEKITASGSDVNFQLDLSHVSPGSYLLFARDKQGNEIGKTRLIKD